MNTFSLIENSCKGYDTALDPTATCLPNTIDLFSRQLDFDFQIISTYLMTQNCQTYEDTTLELRVELCKLHKEGGKTRPLQEVDLRFLVAFVDTFNTKRVYLGLPAILLDPFRVVKEPGHNILRVEFEHSKNINDVDPYRYRVLPPPLALRVIASQLQRTVSFNLLPSRIIG